MVVIYVMSTEDTPGCCWKKVNITTTSPANPCACAILLKEDISIQEEHQMLLIPKSAIFSFPNIQPPRLVPASCAICLQTYTIGSKLVVYSSNPKCKHCFRNDYILRWLLTLSISLSFSISLSLSLLISL